MKQLEIVPGSEHFVIGLTKQYSDDRVISNGDWVAIEFKIPDTPDFNTLTRFDLRRKYCMMQNCGWIGFRSGFSRVLTNNEARWIQDTITQREIEGDWTEAIYNVNVPVQPGETIYWIGNYYTGWDNGNIRDGDGYCYWRFGEQTNYPDGHSYLNGVEMVHDGVPVIPIFMVYGATDMPFVADFVYSPEYPLVDEQIQFTDKSTVELQPQEWTWEFGDGGWSYNRNPKHTYNAPGNYQCRLTSVSIGGSVDTYSRNINVSYELECEDYQDKISCIANGCYWYNNSCHQDTPVSCATFDNQLDCEQYDCYWYNNACYSAPPTPTEFPWWIVGGLVIVGIIATGAFLYKK